MPDTKPENESTVAMNALLLFQIPPDVESLKNVVLPAVTVDEPVIIRAVALTVTESVVTLLPTVYVITAVPAETPATIPVTEPTVAIAYCCYSIFHRMYQ